jgi:hypothetical protein
MKVKFLREFGGRETKEIHYPKDFEVELDDEVALDLSARGICEAEVIPEPAPAPPKVRAPVINTSNPSKKQR